MVVTPTHQEVVLQHTCRTPGSCSALTRSCEPLADSSAKTYRRSDKKTLVLIDVMGAEHLTCMANGNPTVSRTRTLEASCKQTILETDLLNSGCCCRHVKAARTWIGLEPLLQLNAHSVLLVFFDYPSLLDGLYCSFWAAWTQRKHSSSSKRLLGSPLMHDGISLTKNSCYAGYPCTTQHDELIERHDVLKKKQAIYKVRTRDKWKKKKQTRERERESERERLATVW